MYLTDDSSVIREMTFRKCLNFLNTTLSMKRSACLWDPITAENEDW
jgi:hypothetical protein